MLKLIARFAQSTTLGTLDHFSHFTRFEFLKLFAKKTQKSEIRNYVKTWDVSWDIPFEPITFYKGEEPKDFYQYCWSVGCTDADEDGYYAESGCGGDVDCDDNDSDINPGSVEICGDGKDNDCQGGDQVCQTKVIATAVYPGNNHTYYLLAADSWTGAEATAVELGGHLVTINNAEENQWVLETFGPAAVDAAIDWTWLWIGFTDASVEGTWEWTSGEPGSYTNWGVSNNDSPEPNGHQGEDYAAMNPIVFNGITPGAWIDTTYTAWQPVDAEKPLRNYGVVEVE